MSGALTFCALTPALLRLLAALVHFRGVLPPESYPALAPYLGAPWVYGSAGEDPAAPGQLPVARLVADYGLPELRPIAALFMAAWSLFVDSGDIEDKVDEPRPD